MLVKELVEASTDRLLIWWVMPRLIDEAIKLRTEFRGRLELFQTVALFGPKGEAFRKLLTEDFLVTFKTIEKRLRAAVKKDRWEGRTPDR